MLRNTLMKAGIAGWLVFLFGLSLGNVGSVLAQTSGDNTAYLGQWADTQCAPIGNNLYLKRNFDLTSSSWVGTFPIYGAADCAEASKQFINRVTGSLAVGGAYAAIPGAKEAVFGFGKVSITPLSAGIVDALNKAGCGSGQWQIGQEQDISAKGCAALGATSVSECSAEYDLLLLKDGQLYLGNRSKSLCNSPTNRPTKPTALGLSKLASATPVAAPATGQGGTGNAATTNWLPLLGLLVLTGLTGSGLALYARFQANK